MASRHHSGLTANVLSRDCSEESSTKYLDCCASMTDGVKGDNRRNTALGYCCGRVYRGGGTYYSFSKT